MPTLQLSDAQVVDLFRQLKPEQKRAALFALAQDARRQREARIDYAEGQLRKLCAKRGLDWDTMSEDEREDLIDDLIHEDRECQK
jgi:hypothetical protein